MRRIKMTVNACGPQGNFLIDQEFDVPEVVSAVVADDFVNKGYANEIGTISAPETAVSAPAKKETAESKPAQKETAAKPAANKGGRKKAAPKTES